MYKGILPSWRTMFTAPTAALLASWCLFGCMQATKVDWRLRPYVAAFERDTGTVVTYDVYVSSAALFTGEEIAYCRIATDSMGTVTKGVYVSEEVLTESETYIDQVMYHELAHCSLNAEHVGYVQLAMDSQCPTSVMVPYHFDDRCWGAHKQYYVTQLLQERHNRLGGI